MNTNDYRNAPSNIGPQAATWKDKPHRLVYDLCSEIERLINGDGKYPKVLTHYGKHGSHQVVVLDKEQEQQAWLAMFRFLDECEQFYEDLDSDQLEWCEAARQGDSDSARWLIGTRCNYEYERVEMESTHTPASLMRELDK
jgi:hypothetical protein